MLCLRVASASRQMLSVENAPPLVLSVWEEQRRLALWRLDVHSWPISVLLSRLHFCNISLFLSTEVGCNNKLFVFFPERKKAEFHTKCAFFWGEFWIWMRDSHLGWDANPAGLCYDQTAHRMLSFGLLHMHECARAARGALHWVIKFWMRVFTLSSWVSSRERELICSRTLWDTWLQLVVYLVYYKTDVQCYITLVPAGEVFKCFQIMESLTVAFQVKMDTFWIRLLLCFD